MHTTTTLNIEIFKGDHAPLQLRGWMKCRNETNRSEHIDTQRAEGGVHSQHNDTELNCKEKCCTQGRHNTINFVISDFFIAKLTRHEMVLVRCVHHQPLNVFLKLPNNTWVTTHCCLSRGLEAWLVYFWWWVAVRRSRKRILCVRWGIDGFRRCRPGCRLWGSALDGYIAGSSVSSCISEL